MADEQYKSELLNLDYPSPADDDGWDLAERQTVQEPVVFILDTAGRQSGYAMKSTGSFVPMQNNDPFQSPYDGAKKDLQRVDQGYAMAYATCVWAFRGIQIRSQKVAELLRDAKLVDVQTGKPVKGTLYQEAVDRAFMTYYQDFYEEWLFWKCLTGEAFIHLERAAIEGTDINFPIGMRVLNSLATEPNIQGNTIKDFSYSQEDGTPLTIDSKDMIFDKFRNPFDDLRGYSLLGASMDAINIDRSIAILNKNFIKNNARPGLIFTPKSGKLGTSDGQLVKDFVAEKVKGAGNAGKPLVMPFPMDVTVAKPPDLEDQGYLTDDQKTRILATIGVPMGMVDYGDMRYQMSPEQRRGFYNETVIPDAGHCLMVANVGPLRFFDPQRRYRLELDLTRIMPILEDQQIRTNTTNIRYRSGLLSWNESRVEQGALPDPKGDFYIMPDGYTIVKKENLGEIDKALVNAAAGYTVDNEGPTVEPEIQEGLAAGMEKMQAVTAPPAMNHPGSSIKPGAPGAPKAGGGPKGAGMAGAPKGRSSSGDSSFGGSPSGLPKLPVPAGVTYHPHIDTQAQTDFPFTKSVVEGWEKELNTWMRFTYRNGARKSLRFACEIIPSEVASAIKTALTASSEQLISKSEVAAFFDDLKMELKAAAKPDKQEIFAGKTLEKLEKAWEKTGLGFLLKDVDKLKQPENEQEKETKDGSAE